MPAHPLLQNLNALAGGLFLLAAFGMVATRQIAAGLRLFMAQAFFLASSAFLFGIGYGSPDLFAVAGLNVVTKIILIPWLLRRNVRAEIYTRREIVQVLNIPTTLLTSLALVIAAWFFARPLVAVASADSPGAVSLPVGIAGMFLGALTLAVRREAVPQFLGMLAMENSAFFAGIAIAPTLPLLAEAAVAFDILILTLVIGLLTRTIHEHIGTTDVGSMVSLREEHREDKP